MMAMRPTTALDEAIEPAPLGLGVADGMTEAADPTALAEALLDIDIVELVPPVAKIIATMSWGSVMLLLTAKAPLFIDMGFAAISVCMYITFAAVSIIADVLMPAQFVFIPQLLAYVLPAV